MLWVLSYIQSNWMLIIVAVLLIAILGVIAFFLKNWKLAVAAAAVLALGLAYQQIDKNAYQRRIAEEKQAELDHLKKQRDTANEIADADMERATKDAARIEELEQRVSQTPANSGPCLDIDAARRVRSIR